MIFTQDQKLYKLYVGKDRYDTLLRQFMHLKHENNQMREAWTELKRRTKRIDDRVLDDVYQFETLEEEKAYLIGAFNAKKAIEWDMEELEVNCHAETGK